MQQNDIKIEKAVLGALILENDAFIDVQDIIHEDLFYNDFHKATLTAIKSLFAKGTAIDTLTVLNKLKEENVKATAYDVVELTNAIESSANIEHHIYILKVLSYKRKALNIAKTIIRETNENKDIFKVLQDAEHSLLNIDTNTRSTEAQAYKISQEYATELDSYIKGDIEVSINTGLYFIDKKLGGYKPKLYILAARPAMGKTVTMAQILLNISKKGKRVGLFSLEMGKKEITQRLLANVSRVEYSKITNYNLNSQEINNILTESEKLNNYFLIDFYDFIFFKIELVMRFYSSIISISMLSPSGIGTLMTSLNVLSSTARSISRLWTRISYLSQIAVPFPQGAFLVVILSF